MNFSLLYHELKANLQLQQISSCNRFTKPSVAKFQRFWKAVRNYLAIHKAVQQHSLKENTELHSLTDIQSRFQGLRLLPWSLDSISWLFEFNHKSATMVDVVRSLWVLRNNPRTHFAGNLLTNFTFSYRNLMNLVLCSKTLDTEIGWNYLCL